MKLSIRLTMDGLIRALRTRAEAIAAEREDETRRQAADAKTEDRDERRP